MNAKGTSTHNTCIQQPLQTSQGMEHHLYCQWLEDWSSSGQISTKLTVLMFPMAVELCKFSSCSNLSICNGNCSNRFHLRRLAMNFHCFNILADVMDLPCKVECVMSLYFLHWLYIKYCRSPRFDLLVILQGTSRGGAGGARKICCPSTPDPWPECFHEVSVGGLPVFVQR